eukprot:TRINITY_DN25127_c0_g4_i1.p1 TRINITY_DN25127_c0_g4~~TRINITY_DN25127_c0_g4_i1.p1  ORF type:complete len:771 (-),score=87.71 TRINITY_DN25127_c0_g4_i1:28-2340(-)
MVCGITKCRLFKVGALVPLCLHPAFAGDPGAPLEGWQGVCAVHSDRPREDNLWMLQSAVLVITMNAAFGLFEAGCVGKKNVLNIMMKNLGDITLGGLVWWLFGFRLAFPSIAKNNEFPFKVFDESFWFFQWTFAATAATIDSGSLAERVNFIPYCILSMITTGVVYPVAVSWVWDADGFLANMDPPFMDFAGGSLVHMVGGFSALVACSILGPRIGRFNNYAPSWNSLAQVICRRSIEPDYYIVPAGDHNIAFVTDPVSLIWGTFFLWIGWYGFNPGGVGEIDGAGTYIAARVMVNTTMGAFGGGFVAFVWCLIVNRGKVRAETLSMSVLSGLVSVTAGVYWFEPGASFLVGAVGAFLAIPVHWCLEKLTIDDVVGAIPVHGACGFIGTIAIPFFAKPWGCSGNETVGLVYASTDEEYARAWRLLGVQAYGCLIIGLWTCAVTFAVVAALNQIPFLRFRVDRDVELHGCDSHEHGMKNDQLVFQDTLKFVLENISYSKGRPEDVVRVFSQALQTLANNGPVESRVKTNTSIKRHQQITVTVKELEGLLVFYELDDSSDSEVNLNAKLHIMCEVVNATKVQGGTYERNYNYFAPKNTYAADPTGKIALSWGDEPLIFPAFKWPAEGEDRIHCCVTLVKGSTKVGQAFVPLYHSEFAENGGAFNHDVMLTAMASRWQQVCDAVTLKLAFEIPPCPRRRHSPLKQLKRSFSSSMSTRSGDSPHRSASTSDYEDLGQVSIASLEEKSKAMQEQINGLKAMISSLPATRGMFTDV